MNDGILKKENVDRTEGSLNVDKTETTLREEPVPQKPTPPSPPKPPPKKPPGKYELKLFDGKKNPSGEEKSQYSVTKPRAVKF